jgi:hypothetical protein
MDENDMKKYEETLDYLKEQEKQESEYYKSYINNSKEENYINNYKIGMNDDYGDDEDNDIHYDDEDEEGECDFDIDDNINNKMSDYIPSNIYSKEIKDYDNYQYIPNFQDDDNAKLLQNTIKNYKPTKKSVNNSNEEDDLKSLENNTVI